MRTLLRRAAPRRRSSPPTIAWPSAPCAPPSKRDCRVPDDISIVGVDDIELAPYLTPPLTTVRQSLADVATLATKILLDLLHGREPAQTQVVFQPELVVRDSTANPPTHTPHALKEVSKASS